MSACNRSALGCLTPVPQSWTLRRLAPKPAANSRWLGITRTNPRAAAVLRGLDRLDTHTHWMPVCGLVARTSSGVRWIGVQPFGV